VPSSLLAALPWLVRASWLVLPFFAGPAWADALDERSVAVRTTASVLLWSAWAVGLLATLVPRPLGLTPYRVVAAAAPVAALAAVATGGEVVGPGAAAAALIATGVAAVVALLPETGELFVQGGAYGDERRFLLRAPGPVLIGPLQLAWAMLVAGVVTGPLLLAAGQWVAGALATAVGAGFVVVLGRALHSLVGRWIVFVPAGFVLKDHVALVDPVLFRRTDVAVLRPAPADADALDLTARSPGLALELRLHEKVPMLRAPAERGGEPQPGKAMRLLVTPSRPGAVLEEARRRRLPVDVPVADG
jgi:hypothetical protein